MGSSSPAQGFASSPCFTRYAALQNNIALSASNRERRRSQRASRAPALRDSPSSTARGGAGSGSGQGWMSSALRGAVILLRCGGTTARAGGTGATGFVQIPPFHSSSAFAPVFAFPKGTASPPTPYAFATRKGQRKRNACGTGGAPFLSWGSTPGQDQRPDFCKSPFCRVRACVGGFTSVSA